MKVAITSLHNITHLGHLSLLEDAVTYGDELIVIVNTDEQIRKRGTCPLFDQDFRLKLIKSLWYVTDVRLAIDDDCGVADTLRKIVYDYNFVYNTLNIFTGSKSKPEFYFCKGGNRSSLDKLPQKEQDVIRELEITPIFGCGGFEKTDSTTDVLLDVAKWHIKNNKV